MSAELPRRNNGTPGMLALLRQSTPLLSPGELASSVDELRADRSERSRCSRRVWAAAALAHDIYVCESILRGNAVRAGNLDRIALRRALRGGTLPPAESFIAVTDDMLDAVSEAGPLPRATGFSKEEEA